MKVVINGKSQEFPRSQKLHEVISQFRQETSRIIAELNGEIVKHANWDKTVIKDGDRIELVTFVGGG